jgi:hypothetical protein
VITTPTVLVLGAGASLPYGFPTAKELKGLICDAFDHPNAKAIQLLAGATHSSEEFFQFREAFRKSGQSSVDAFLQRRPEFLGIGKLAIAYCLIPFEEEAKLYRPDPSRGNDWYGHLSEKLNSPFEQFGDNKLSIITFNYDRSLEHFLLNSLHYLHGRKMDDCSTALAKIPIIHVYGQLGKHPYPQKDCRPYLPNRETFGRVEQAAAGITLLHEQAADLGQAHQLLNDARRICFLGFSYHSMNLERLQLENSSIRRAVFGTARGFVGDELPAIIEQLNRTLLGGNVKISDADNLQVLKQYLILGWR